MASGLWWNLLIKNLEHPGRNQLCLVCMMPLSSLIFSQNRIWSMVILSFFFFFRSKSWLAVKKKIWLKFLHLSFWVLGISMVFSIFSLGVFLVIYVLTLGQYCKILVWLISLFILLCISFLATSPSQRNWLHYTIEPMMLRTLLSDHVPISFPDCACQFYLLMFFFFLLW